MAQASILGLMEDATKVSTKMTNYMAKASLLGLMVNATRVSTRMAK